MALYEFLGFSRVLPSALFLAVGQKFPDEPGVGHSKAFVAFCVDVVPSEIPALPDWIEVKCIGVVNCYARIVREFGSKVIDYLSVNFDNVDVLYVWFREAHANKASEPEACFQNSPLSVANSFKVPAQFLITVVHHCVSAETRHREVDPVQAMNADIE